MKKVKKKKRFYQHDYFIRSREWKEIREQALLKYKSLCMRCGNKKSVQIDHILPRKTHPELALSIANLQVLCAACNKEKSNSSTRDYRTADQLDTSKAKTVDCILRKSCS